MLLYVCMYVCSVFNSSATQAVCSLHSEVRRNGEFMSHVNTSLQIWNNITSNIAWWYAYTCIVFIYWRSVQGFHDYSCNQPQDSPPKNNAVGL